MNGVNTFLSSRAGQDAHLEAMDRLDGRLGLNVPHEWWPRAAALKAIEAAGVQWIQVASPPVEMLADPRHVVRHGQTLRGSLGTTGLRTVVHGPTSLKLGSSLHNRAGEGLIEYAHQLGAAHVVYHALNVRSHGPESESERRALELLARWGEALGVVVCVENLCPVYPGPARVCHDPEAVRKLVLEVDSPALRMVFDVGHANVVADGEGCTVASLAKPVLDVVGLFHVHDNLGARRYDGGGHSFDPLRLDLHLPPGLGTVQWEKIAPMLVDHEAPLVMEVHPSHRPPALALREALLAVLIGEEPATTALETVPNLLA